MNYYLGPDNSVTKIWAASMTIWRVIWSCPKMGTVYQSIQLIYNDHRHKQNFPHVHSSHFCLPHQCCSYALPQLHSTIARRKFRHVGKSRCRCWICNFDNTCCTVDWIPCTDFRLSKQHLVCHIPCARL
jgi:hypothetical protein